MKDKSLTCVVLGQDHITASVDPWYCSGMEESHSDMTAVMLWHDNGHILA